MKRVVIFLSIFLICNSLFSQIDVYRDTSVNVIENNIPKSEKNFNKTVSYNNNSNKFELKQYEDKIASNLTNKIIEEIIIYLQSI